MYSSLTYHLLYYSIYVLVYTTIFIRKTKKNELTKFKVTKEFFKTEEFNILFNLFHLQKKAKKSLLYCCTVVLTPVYVQPLSDFTLDHLYSAFVSV